MVRRLSAVSLLIALLSASVLEARVRPINEVQPGRRKYALYNIGLTSVFTLASALVQHQKHSARDVVRYLLIGAGAGFSFYEAKRITGGGRTTEGWLLANAVASVVENTTSGEHPFGRIGYTVGPLRFRFATPLARNAVATIESDWSLSETRSLIKALRQGDHIRVRHGLIAVDRDTPWHTSDLPGGLFGGRTFGVFPGVAPGQGDITWQHEMVHVIQDQQLDSVEPPVYTFGGTLEPSKPRSLFAFRHIRFGFIHVLDEPELRRPYNRRWNEIEAYGLAQHKPVPH
jgi:hypothetical protein